MLNIGLTGGIGSGKSTVAQWFIKQGVPVLDADKTVHRLLQSDQTTVLKLIEEFGTDILDENGQIDRSSLGKLVFREEDARKRLERIVHPRVVQSMNEERDTLSDTGVKICVWDVPLLFEAGFEKFVDEVWVVWIPRNLQISRVLARDKLSLSEVEARIASQGSLDEKRQRGDVIIDNSGSESQTIGQLEDVWQKLLLRQKD
ncbi:dephospho-CoA kinase [Desulfosporosinus nitroreducens]|uniref:Dephospho-CoA kinase n=1 Tax=Desulfosporosinus nitroreducens TaxID=2018668 RepID=A0ABT8QVW1_9FIRM|nr:dephospho-CoA kinase [Desulfosporosinus nitroreducens]MCO1603582.1 dephospho-CoA kinase [Desulfosporosinus nitroreducens]MDO0825487.1 dephospho-CoA kinase [Desulfosporosinus nitroreducens]